MSSRDSWAFGQPYRPVVTRHRRMSLVLGVLTVFFTFGATVALASSVDESIVDATAPTGSVAIAPGASGPITINLSVTGRQDNPASFQVNRDWSLSGGTFTGSNPQTFNVSPRAATDPATTFSTTGTLSIAAGQADGTFTLAVGAFGIVTTAPAALSAGTKSSYSVTVLTPTPSDSSPPVISYVLNPALPDGDNGWYKSNVTLTWTVTENESPSSLVKTGCVDQDIDADQAATTYSCSATSEGGSAGPVNVSIKRDGTAPTVAYTSASGTLGNNGWYTSDVVATFTATDNLSGFDAGGTSTTTDTSTSSGEGSSVNVDSPAFIDYAGNTMAAGSASHGFMIDKTPPIVSVTGVSDGATYTLGSVPAAGCATSDATSGAATDATLSTSGGPVGSITATCSGAEDNAGLTNSASVTYSVIYSFFGFFQPVDNLPTLNSVKAGSAIPVKFSLGGDQGLSILAAGYPSSAVITCGADAATDAIETTVTAGGSTLSYDATANQYVYVWKTDKAWAGTCRTLVVKLADGTLHKANFKLMK